MSLTLNSDDSGTTGSISNNIASVQLFNADGTVTFPYGLVLVLAEYADDSSAEAGGVPVNGLYHTGSAVKVRVL